MRKRASWLAQAGRARSGRELYGQRKISVEWLIVPSGSWGGTYGLLFPRNTRPFVSRAVARLDPGPIDRDHPHQHQPYLPTQPEHIIKQLSDPDLPPPAKLCNRRMIRHPHARDHLVGDVLPTRPLDPARGAGPARVRDDSRLPDLRRCPYSGVNYTLLRGPVEPWPPSPVHTELDPQHPTDTLPRTVPDPSARPPPRTVHTGCLLRQPLNNDGGINNN
jgi:hypothetical protein